MIFNHALNETRVKKIYRYITRHKRNVERETQTQLYSGKPIGGPYIILPNRKQWKSSHSDFRPRSFNVARDVMQHADVTGMSVNIVLPNRRRLMTQLSGNYVHVSSFLLLCISLSQSITLFLSLLLFLLIMFKEANTVAMREPISPSNMGMVPS